jgi:NAD(P)-dependent dehydrogenase (short-subunit alcohol dehydrogenase family)
MIELDLSDQVAVVTGGTAGIGRAISEALADAGADVVPVSRTKELIEETNEAVDGDLVLPTDVSERAEVEAMLETVADHYGKINVLVNCAGIFQNEKPPEEITDEDWNPVLQVNLYGAFVAAQTVPQYMPDDENKSIVNVGSMVRENPLKGITAYCASKGGMMSMTRSLAIEYGERDIRVNIIEPGYVKTRQNREALESESLKESIMWHTPLKRYGKTEEMASAAVFLASPAASFITGESITIDGGYSVF